MDTVVLDGVEYVKASVAAKRFHYTSDYIGQLCRGKKIDARLVGRTWFVNPDSITDHKEKKVKKRAQKSEQADPAVHEVSISTSEVEQPAKRSFRERIAVASPLKSKTARALKVEDTTPKAEKGKVEVQYQADAESLLPEIISNTNTESKSLRIDHADAKSIRVRKQKVKGVAFVAEELPSVALSGTISVSGYDQPEEKAVEEATPVVKPVKSHAKPKKPLNTAVSTRLTKEKDATEPQIQENEHQQQGALNNNTLGAPPQSFSPRSIQTISAAAARPSLFLRFSPAFATAAAITLVFGILAASSQVISSETENTSRIIFQVC